MIYATRIVIYKTVDLVASICLETGNIASVVTTHGDSITRMLTSKQESEIAALVRKEIDSEG